jgi:hypothetical protein
MLSEWLKTKEPCKEGKLTVNGKLTICRQISFAPNYAVTIYGDVISFAGERPQILRPSLHSSKYRVVTITDANKRRSQARISALVCFAFHGPQPTQEHVARHIDGNKELDAAANLRWDTEPRQEIDKFQLAIKREQTLLTNVNITQDNSGRGRPTKQNLLDASREELNQTAQQQPLPYYGRYGKP